MMEHHKFRYLQLKQFSTFQRKNKCESFKYKNNDFIFYITLYAT